MRIAISTNLNGIGLEVDADLLARWLIERDHEVEICQFDAPMPLLDYDLAICLEVVTYPRGAKRLFYIANPEWLLPSYIRTIQRSFDKVLAKTRDAEKVLKERFSNVIYTGFMSRDRAAASVRAEAKFLHLGGNSGFRNTAAVIEAWRSYRYWNGASAPDAPLTVVSNSKLVSFEKTEGVTFIRRATDEQITELQNSHLFHLMPSAYEGYGQALHESQSVGAILLTTGAGPMAELNAPFEVPPILDKKNNLAMLREVSAQHIREKIPVMLSQPNTTIARMRIEARARWEQGQREFTERMEELIKPSFHSLNPRPRLAILGNFEPPHSTENDLLWTLKDMGYEVTSFQENKDRTEEILSTCQNRQIALLIYVHTHGWETPGTISLEELIVRLRASKIKTCSFHLDRYWGLNALDKREDRIGLHPFWRTDAQFTADGGNQANFQERLRSDTHHWLRPGVVERDCYSGHANAAVEVEVGFVGASSYHPEYPFRGQLIEFLHDAYGVRFRTFQGYRGEELNDLYASIKVVVGDSCFAGADYYWSDRVPETLGRGGFLVHPATKGLTIPGLVTFEPGNLCDLQDRIDYYLEHEDERDRLKECAFYWVRENETYTNRMKVLLRTMEVE